MSISQSNRPHHNRNQNGANNSARTEMSLEDCVRQIVRDELVRCNVLVERGPMD
jgi:hypothetical protein